MPKAIEWTESLENNVLSDIEAGLSLRVTGENYGISASAIIRHIQDSEVFAKQYARAKEIQLESMADQMLTIADSANSDSHQAARLQVDTRKWLLSKLVPKKYGDFQRNEISGPDGAPIQSQVTVEFVKSTKSGVDVSK